MFKSLFVALLLQSTIQAQDSVELITSGEILETADVLSGEEKYDEALSLLKKVPDVDTAYFEVQAKILSVYNAATYYDSTKLVGKELITKPSEYKAEMIVSIANAYLEAGDLDQAINKYEKGLKQYPFNYVMMYNMGIAYYRDKKYEQANHWFQRNLKVNPFYSSSHIMLGYISLLEGNRTKSLMSYMTYLMLKPENNGVLVTLENLVSNALRNEGTIEKITDNSLFVEYDNLLKSKAALDDRFEREVDFNASIVKQTQLLLSKLKYQESDDFWMTYYVPLFNAIQQAGFTDVLLNFALQSTGNEDVLSWLDKNDKRKSQWVDVVNNKLYDFRKTTETTLFGELNTYTQWFYNSNKLSAIGNKKTEDVRTGPWVFYHDNDEKSAEGFYNQTGTKIEKWVYWNTDGSFNREEVYSKEGKIIEPVKYYRSDSSLSIIARYDGVDLDGFLDYCYECGEVRERVPYQKGKNTGKGEYYFETGEKKVDYTMAEEELNGPYKIYFKDGSIKVDYYFKDGKRSGKYVSYHYNGQIDEQGNYEAGLSVGEWVGYYDDGTLSYKGSLIADEKVGDWKYFYPNGNVRQTETYNQEGKLEGIFKAYTENGILFTERQYTNDIWTSYKYYDTKGTLLSEAQHEEGNMPLKSYYSNGVLKEEIDLEGGEKNGPYKEYNADGILKLEGVMKDNELDGQLTRYYSSGAISVKCMYETGELSGYYQSFYKNGNLSSQGYYIDNSAEQEWRSYYPDGTLKEVSYYRSGKYEGPLHSYAADGKIFETTTYEGGNFVGLIQYDTLGNVTNELKMPNSKGPVVYEYPSGKKRFEGQLLCGYYVEDNIGYFPSGQKMSITTTKNSEYHGPYAQYGFDGKVLIEGEYVHNERNGLWKYFEFDGTLSSDRVYDNGEIDGVANYYYDNGQIEAELSYSTGSKHGPSRYYDRSGNLIILKHYDRDIGFMGYQYYKTDGELIDTIFVDASVEKVVAYFQNGQKSTEQSYENGVFNGQLKYFNNNGQVISIINYEHGDYHGDYKEFYDDGTPSYKAKYVNDELEGIVLKYYPNGKIKESSSYHQGDLNGFEKIYSVSGKLLKATYYWNGYIYE